MTGDNSKFLYPEQIRVLACLMEKHLATPNNYPLTPNSLTLAVNQKSNRHPVVAWDEGLVVSTARMLKEMGYISIDHSERIDKFSHRAPGVFKISREEQAILAMLMLREPLTLNDLKARTEKMIGFDSIEQVEESVLTLMALDPPLVMALPKAVGQREQRYTHLLAGEPDLSAIEVKVKETRPAGNTAKKMAELEARIDRLEKALNL